jgi:signal transduction histidine kinase
MSYVTVTYSVVAACALLLGLLYGLVWVMDRKSRASLAFACLALAVVCSVVIELCMMRSQSAEEWGEWVRWSQVPIFIRVAATVAFIRLYFGTGRTWLMWLIIGLRFSVMTIGFFVDPNFNYARIDSISHLSFLGEQVTVMGNAVASPWQWVATVTSVLPLIFVTDASIQLWRSGTRETRRTALVVGGATLFSIGVGTFYSQLMILGGWRLPALLSPPYLVMLAAMTLELSRDMLRASRLASELRESQSRLEVAAAAAGLGLWTWNTEKFRLWATSSAKSMCGLDDRDPVDTVQLLSRIDPGDIARVEEVWRQAAKSGAEAEVQLRIRLPDGNTRLLAARGRSEADETGRITTIQGVLRDVTEQFRARQENEELRRDLAHAGRVSVLGTLSSSLAHELSQPLGAIMLNTEAAELILKRPDPDLEEIRQILADIHRDDRRAAEVIDGLRKLLKRGRMDPVPLSVEDLVHDVAALLRSDAIARNVMLECSADPGISQVRGDKVHLSQVLINLIMNGMDAVAQQPAALRRVTLRARADGPAHVELLVTDSGAGIPEPEMQQIFDPFFTTKTGGMGMGLSVSRTIVDAHGGRLWAENSASEGAVFHVTLPVLAVSQTDVGVSTEPA